MKNSDNPNTGNPPARFGFEMLFKEDEKYYFRFNDRDGQPLLFSKGYSSEKSCANGIQATIRAAGKDGQYDFQETKKGKYFFILKSGNHQEIARSRIFDTLEELEEQMELLKGIDEDIPQYGLDEVSPEKEEPTPQEREEVQLPERREPEKAEAPDKKEDAAESRKEPVKTAVVAEKPSALPESVEKRPRYKFSIIYYPDSRIWMVKNDFSGGSVKLKTCDGQQIAAFLKSQLPPEEREVTPPSAHPEAVKPKGVPVKPKSLAGGEVELNLCTPEGALMQRFADKGRISKVELVPKGNEGIQIKDFEARIMAKSMENNQTIMIGSANHLSLVNGRFEVPIHGASRLKAGLYRFTADIYRGGREEQPVRFYGSRVIMLN